MIPHAELQECERGCPRNGLEVATISHGRTPRLCNTMGRICIRANEYQQFRRDCKDIQRHQRAETGWCKRQPGTKRVNANQLRGEPHSDRTDGNACQPVLPRRHNRKRNTQWRKHREGREYTLLDVQLDDKYRHRSCQLRGRDARATNQSCQSKTSQTGDQRRTNRQRVVGRTLTDALRTVANRHNRIARNRKKSCQFTRVVRCSAQRDSHGVAHDVAQIRHRQWRSRDAWLDVGAQQQSKRRNGDAGLVFARR